MTLPKGWRGVYSTRDIVGRFALPPFRDFSQSPPAFRGR
jgi:hypothetical protein